MIINLMNNNFDENEIQKYKYEITELIISNNQFEILLESIFKLLNLTRLDILAISYFC